jgi:hypothetical protein
MTGLHHTDGLLVQDILLVLLILAVDLALNTDFSSEISHKLLVGLLDRTMQHSSFHVRAQFCPAH